jgi:hypothetical protein
VTDDHSPRPRVALAADESLLAETVALALGARGFQTTTVNRFTGVPLRPEPLLGPTDLGVLLTGVETSPDSYSVRDLLGRLRLRWVVVTPIPRDPGWRALLADGAAALVGSDMSVDELTVLLDDLGRVAGPATDLALGDRSRCVGRSEPG